MGQSITKHYDFIIDPINIIPLGLIEMNLKPVAGESDITPLNGFVRVQDTCSDGEWMHGIVTDQRVGQCKYGDIVYFPKSAAQIIRVNGNEVIFVNESQIVFRVA